MRNETQWENYQKMHWSGAVCNKIILFKIQHCKILLFGSELNKKNGIYVLMNINYINVYVRI